MVQNVCRQQFTRRNFGFRCKEEEKNLFYRSQWSNNRVVFLVYRTFMALYSTGWMVAWYIYNGVQQPERLATAFKYFTIWAEATSAIYFSLSFVLSAVGVARRKRSNRLEGKAIKLLRSSAWIFFGPAFMIQIVMLIIYWGFLVPGLSSEWNPDAFTYHQHLVTVIMILLDIFIAAFPIRLLHVIYSILGGVLYITMTLILHATGEDHAVYSFLNWKDNPGLAAGISLGLCFAGTLLIQTLAFGFYLLRTKIYDNACFPPVQMQSATSTVTRSHSQVGVDDVYFNHRVVIRQESLPMPSDYF